MKQYKILGHPTCGIEAVKQGWSWPAFFLAALWALHRRMWKLAVVSYGAFLLLNFSAMALFVDFGAFTASAEFMAALLFGTEPISLVVLLPGAVLFGLFGNRWREEMLLRRGFEVKARKTAPTPESATLLFMGSQPAAAGVIQGTNAPA
jgi:hypothetical protein